MADINERMTGKRSGHNNIIISDENIAPTIAASGCIFRMIDGKWLTDEDFVNVSTFPQDYDFRGKYAHYVCGMSVPPNMMANIAVQIWGQWLKKEKINV